jgi:hypothetical protein
MEIIDKILGILSGVSSNPMLFIIAIGVGVFAVFGGNLWISALLKDWREKKAIENKEKDKAKDIDDLENNHTEAAKKLRDRLRELGQKE